MPKQGISFGLDVLGVLALGVNIGGTTTRLELRKTGRKSECALRVGGLPRLLLSICVFRARASNWQYF